MLHSLLSFLWGVLLAPCVSFATHIAAGVDGPVEARVQVAAAIAVAGTLAVFLRWSPRSDSPRRALAALLIACGVGAALGRAGAVWQTPWMPAVAVLAVALGLAVVGGGAPRLAPLCVGFAAGLAAFEAVLLPRYGFLLTIPPAVALLTIVRLRTPSTHPCERVGLRAFELIVAGCAIGYSFRLLEPFVSQHMSGGRWSATAIVVVAALGGGLTAFATAPIARLRWLDRATRIAFPALLAGALVLAFRGLAATSDVPVISPETPMHDAGAWLAGQVIATRDERLLDLAAAQVLLGLLSLASGAWVGLLTRDRAGAAPVALLLGGFGVGSWLAVTSLTSDHAWPRPLLKEPRDVVLALEPLVDYDVGPERVSRTTRGEDGATRRWRHGRRADRDGCRALEEEEIALPSRVTSGGRLLVVGAARVPHRDAASRSRFDEVATATIDREPTNPLDRRLRTILSDPSSAAAFDAVTILSTPTADGVAHLLHRGRFERLRQVLTKGGRLFVWLDLRAFDAETIGAVAHAVGNLFPDTRAWIALDPACPPLLCLEGGAIAAPAAMSGIAAPIDLAPWIDGSLRVATALDPVVATRAPMADGRDSSIAATRCRDLAAALSTDSSNSDTIAIAALLRAIAGELDPAGAPADQDPTSSLLVALDAAPDHPIVLRHLRRAAVHAATSRDYPRLDEVLRRALIHHPGDAELHFLAGRAAFERDDLPAAIDHLAAATEQNPPEPSDRDATLSPQASTAALWMLGRAHGATDPPDFGAAIAALQAAAEAAPDDVDISRSLGMTLAAAGYGRAAIPHLERVIRMRPDDFETQTRLLEVRSRE